MTELEQKANKYNELYRVIMTMLAIFIAVMALWGVVRIYDVSRQLTDLVQHVDNSSQNTLRYLRCGANIPVDQRKPDFFDECLDNR